MNEKAALKPVRSEPTRKALLEVDTVGWEPARSIGTQLNSFIFRGHENHDWQLSSTSERAAARHRCPPYLLAGREKEILRQFQRRAHHYLPAPPPLDAAVEWLALIQHHGGPTRFLDFTHSFYVASFFACEMATSNSTVWCINLSRVESDLIERGGDETLIDTKLKLHAIADRFILGGAAETRVFCVEPFRLNERATLQQSCFLFPCNIEKSFYSNLVTGLGYTESIEAERIDTNRAIEMTSADFAKYDIIKLNLHEFFHMEALSDLRRMNVSAATLFPGLDGYARSLKYSMRVGEMLERFRIEHLANVTRSLHGAQQSPTEP